MFKELQNKGELDLKESQRSLLVKKNYLKGSYKIYCHYETEMFSFVFVLFLKSYYVGFDERIHLKNSSGSF